MSREKKLMMIAEMGLNLCALDSLDDGDIDALYAGYQRRVATLGNLIILAIRRALSEDCEPFDCPSLPTSREETFKNLGIKEEDA